MGSSSQALSLFAPLLVSLLLPLHHRTRALKIHHHQCWNEPRRVLRDAQNDPRSLQICSEAKSLWI
ncbi:UDP-N-acetylglucosamine--dolichyl-phosphate N-acetylglucosaminephosphotransferase [Sesbania bispinosa]|nr:UDP-N-acetylglucosamine--dolichyl-phosphate N-acetylglucosaminephosphotransferase [Sesbania bispinosa]